MLTKRKNRKDLENAIVKDFRDRDKCMTIHDLFYECYLKRVECRSISEATYTRYCNVFKKYYVNSEMENRIVKELDERELYDFILTIVAENHISAKEYGLLRTITTAMLKTAKRFGLTNISPSAFFSDLDIGKRAFTKKKKPDCMEVYTLNELHAIKEYVKENPSIRNISAIIIAKTGMRDGECVALKPEDIDFKKSTIHVHRTETKYRDRTTNKYVTEVVDVTKSDAGDRYIVVDTETLDFFRLAMLLSKDEYIFSDNGRRIRAHAVRRKLKRICEALEITYRPPHKLRKTYITELEKNQVPKSIIISQVGHSNFKTTEQYYIFDNSELSTRKDIISRALTY
ncbi:site-specific integrase [Lachnoclostridium sp. An169]|uniref:site-specific integrase n=1 Tax=Lachnoclostridium sp. An169 TaxID=1965569 RepID=UPI0013A62C5D|nr:site-specific integrase [Lachnoclostridium sp. An169]